MFSTRRLFSVLPVLSAGLTYVTAASFPFALNARSIMNRQATLDPSDIPAECQSACNTFVTAGNSCSDDTCFCTADVNESLEQCYDCLLGLIQDPDQATINNAQSALSQYEQLCNGEDFGLASLTVSAAAPTGGVPTDSGLSSLPSFSSTARQTDSDESTQISGPSSTAPADSSSAAPAGPSTAAGATSSAGGNTPANTQSAGPAPTTQPGITSGAAYPYVAVNAAVLVLMSGAVALLV